MNAHPSPTRTASAPIPELLPAARAFLDAFGGDIPAWVRSEAEQLEAAIARRQFAADLREQNDPLASEEKRDAAKARAQAYTDRRFS